MAPLPSDQASQSTAERVAKWAQDNAIALTLGAGAVAVGGYWLMTRDSSSSSTSNKAQDASGSSSKEESQNSEEKKTEGSSKKSKSKKKKSKDASKGESNPNKDGGALFTDAPLADLLKLDEEEIRKLPEDKRKEVAQAFKEQGNKAYTGGSLEKAVGLYTKGLAAEQLAVFYSNRAACYLNLGRFEEVIQDCDAALKIDSTYVKALNRRGSARERLGKEGTGEGAEGEQQREHLSKSLTDFTAVAILSQFKDTAAAQSVDRVLKNLATAKAQEILRTREPRLPSPTFVSAYLEAFRPKSNPTLPENPSQGDETLLLAYEALEAKNFPHAFTLFGESIEQGLSNDDLKALAFNMRGTFQFVIGNAKAALEDFDQSTALRPEMVQSWVKKASVHMELSDKDEAFRDFDKAIEADDQDPDIYYHRGQVHFILGEFDAAMQDYQKSTELDDTFIFSQVQYAVALYKTSKTPEATSAFKTLLSRFRDSSEAYNYYGELLLDQQKFEEAISNFDRAIEIESSKEKSSNVLPMINKALGLFQWRQDMVSAEELCKKALEIDPECDVAVATLAQLSLQQAKVPEAIAYFERSAQIARTEPELVNAITYENASRAQLEFIKNFPEQGQALQSLAHAV